MATVAGRTDEHIIDMILTALDSPVMAQRLREQQPDTSGLDEEVRAGETRLEELAEAWADGEITRKEWMAARSFRSPRGTRRLRPRGACR